MSKEDKRAIVAYYTETGLDYRVLLRHRLGNWAKHFGYTDKEHQTIPETLSNVNEQIAKVAHIKNGDRVLDVGCGIGGTSIWLAKDKGAVVTGISIVPVEINKARRLAVVEEISDMVDFLICDMRQTKFKNKTFDAVIGIESVCHLENKDDLVREAYRLLKPGGRLVISDGYVQKIDMSVKEKRQMRKWLDGWAVPNLASIEDMCLHLGRAGFKRITVEDRTKSIMPFSRFLYKWGLVGYPLAKILEFLKIRTPRGTGNVIAAIWQYKTLKKDLWRHQIVSAEK